MTRADTAFIVVTAFWGLIGILCPFLVQLFMYRSPNKGIVQIMFIMTAACCYLFWLCAFLFQLNPLFGPQLESNMIRVMQAEWDGLNIEHHPFCNHLEEEEEKAGCFAIYRCIVTINVLWLFLAMPWVDLQNAIRVLNGLDQS